jgi:alpha-beta hydrolase superfamily lysophospholipase
MVGADAAVTRARAAGFFVSYNNSSLEPNITAAVRAMAARHPGAPLYAIGHSMGAAMATIAALDLKFKANLSDVRLVTFGSPRVGNDVFARFTQSQTTVRRGALLRRTLLRSRSRSELVPGRQPRTARCTRDPHRGSAHMSCEVSQGVS